jgi:hypothetical protein
VPDTITHGVALGIRDVPQRGMIVRVAAPAIQGLEPADAAELGRALIALADEAMLAEQAKRRSSR